MLRRHLRGKFRWGDVWWAGIDQEQRIAGAGLSKTTHKEFREVCGTRVSVKQGQAAAPATGEASRGRIWHIPKFSNCYLHFFSSVRLDIGFAVDDARDGHRRDAGYPRDIGNGRSSTGASCSA